MYVCICNAVTERTIRESARHGVHSFAELRRRTGCGDCCGSCEELAVDILREATSAQSRKSRKLDLPLIADAA